MRELFAQIIKYGVVGIANTLLTAIVIWLVLLLFSGNNDESSPSIAILFSANALGYLAGLISSFILNRRWTFGSKTDKKSSFARFLLVFLFCYFIQLSVVWWLNKEFLLISAYTCQLIGMVVYAVLNFLLNKYYTFSYKTFTYENT